MCSQTVVVTARVRIEIDNVDESEGERESENEYEKSWSFVPLLERESDDTIESESNMTNAKLPCPRHW